MEVRRYPITFGGETAQIGTAGELTAALNVLQGQHDREAIEQLSANLADIIADEKGFLDVVKVLTGEERLHLIGAIGSDLPRIFDSAKGLRNVLAALAETRVEIALLEGIGAEGLRAMISSPQDLAEVLYWVYGDCNRLVLDLIGADFLKDLFQNGFQVSLVFNAMDHEAQLALLKMISWERLAELVRDHRDLSHLMRALPDDTSKLLVDMLTKDALWAIIRDERGWLKLKQFLSADEVTHLEKILEVKGDA